jgi:hypothetical protein
MALRQLRGGASAPNRTRSNRKTSDFDTVLAQYAARPIDVKEVIYQNPVWDQSRRIVGGKGFVTAIYRFASTAAVRC